ncbi:hypothetical protein [Pseudonocardia sp. NPDC049154]|uniref:hypothetical protein n=1 Tax=Pseudonocardia sp. NPDC049154 TaxID=3155501 RepID=UPI0033FAC12C
MWSLTHVSSQNLTAASGILAADALVRGVDYLIIDQLSPVLATVEKAFDMTTWGVAFLVTAAMVAAGYAAKLRVLLALAHGLIATLYLGLAAGVTSTTFDLGTFPRDVRTAATFVAVALINGLLAWKISEERLRRFRVHKTRGGGGE